MVVHNTMMIKTSGYEIECWALINVLRAQHCKM